MIAGLSSADPVVDQATQLDPSAVVVAVISGAFGFGGAVLMFRGKTQDTANWLVKSLREDAESARFAASEARTEAHEAREDARRAWERVDECEDRHDATTGFLIALAGQLRSAGVDLPDLDLSPNVHLPKEKP